MKKKRLKRQNRILLERCQKLQGQVDALVETYLKYFDQKQTIKVSDWMEEERKRQMRKSNATS
jgi:hypothetical protein